MNTKKFLLCSGILLLALLVFSSESFSQGCVQCRMVPQSDLNNGGSAGANVNNAILYLMAVPYLLLVSIAVYVFRKPLKIKWQEFRAKTAH